MDQWNHLFHLMSFPGQTGRNSSIWCYNIQFILITPQWVPYQSNEEQHMAKINKKLGYNKNANVADVSLFVGLAQDKNRTWKYRYFALKPVCRRHGGNECRFSTLVGLQLDNTLAHSNRMALPNEDLSQVFPHHSNSWWCWVRVAQCIANLLSLQYWHAQNVLSYNKYYISVHPHTTYIYSIWPIRWSSADLMAQIYCVGKSPT